MELVVRLPMRAGGFREARLIEGPAGWGECSPLPGYPCSWERARAAAEEAAFHGWPPACRTDVAVNALIIAGDPESAAAQAAAAVDEGFSCLKVKVGHEPASTVAAVRDAVGAHVALRIDPNGRWDLDEAVQHIRALARFDLELVEQPVATLDGLAAVRRQVDTPVAADECVRTVDDARRLVQLQAADVLVLKVQPLGGVRPALAVAEAAAVPVLVTSMMETSVGLAAGLALAASVPDLPYACGLATATGFEADVVSDPLIPVAGRLAVRRPVPDPVLLDRYRVAAA